jgi:hypothetical protein
MAAGKQSASEPKIATVAELKRSRVITAQLPSGAWVKIRPPNMELHLVNGGLPTSLRAVASQSSKELNRKLADEETGLESLKEMYDYLDRTVRMMIVEPDISEIENLDDVFKPVDYHWLLEVAQRETDVDAQGRMLWGVEPLNRWALFRGEHDCDEDCPACLRLQRVFSASLG